MITALLLIVALGWLLPVRSWTRALADHVRGAGAIRVREAERPDVNAEARHERAATERG